MNSSLRKNHVLVVGGGFGGIKAALTLAQHKNTQVTLVSDHTHFRYYPALYRTATGGWKSGARIRLQTILDGTGIAFIQGTAKTLDRTAKELTLADGQKITFDVVIFALGNVTNYFGIPGMPEYSYGIKSTEEAERFKKHLHQQITDKGRPDLHYVIVGGGPTGIELAGALPSYLKEVMTHHGLRDRTLHITIVEAAPRLLPRAPEDISKAIGNRLKALGIHVMLGTAVQGTTANTLMAGSKAIKTETVVWTAGVANNPFYKENNFKLTDRGKVEVDEFLQAEPGIFVIGDNANTQFSGMAQTALYDGEYVGTNILRAFNKETPEPYLPKAPISVIPVGPRWASVQWGKVHFNGFVGSMLRSFADLIGFHDIEPWVKAGDQWVVSMMDEEMDCPHCSHKTKPAK